MRCEGYWGGGGGSTEDRVLDTREWTVAVLAGLAMYDTGLKAGPSEGEKVE